MLSEDIWGNEANSFIKSENAGRLIVQSNVITKPPNTVKQIINYRFKVIE